MHNLLTKYQEENKLVGLYTDDDNLDKFHVAYIIDVTKDKILECNIGLRGEFDGYSAEFIESVYRVETDSMYIKKIKHLSEKRSTKYELNYMRVDADPFQILLRLAVSNKYITTIYLKSNYNVLVGHVTMFDDEKVYVDLITEYGENDGKTVFYFEDIVRIIVNDVDAQDLSATTVTQG